MSQDKGLLFGVVDSGDDDYAMLTTDDGYATCRCACGEQTQILIAALGLRLVESEGNSSGD